MKKLVTLITFLLLIGISNSYAQVAINIDGTMPDPTAMLDVKANNLGFLPPRLSVVQRDAIPYPAEGLIIYNIDAHCLEFYNSFEWVNKCGIQNIQCGGIYTYEEVYNPSSDEIWLDRNLGAEQVATAMDDYQSYGALYQWGRGSDEHECMSWTSPTSGSPDNGSTSTLSSGDNSGHNSFITNSFSTHDWRDPQNDNLWQGVSGINNPCPSGFRLPTQIDLANERSSWTHPGALGAFASPLKLNLPGNRNLGDAMLYHSGSKAYYWSSTINGTNVHRLYFNHSTSSITDDFRAYGYSIRCIKDTPIELTQCGRIFTYGEIENPTTTDTWLDKNLGANQVATSSNDYEAYGSLFQWGRKNDGHECIVWTGAAEGSPESGTSTVLSSSDNPGHSNFILFSPSPYDWRNPQNDNLWQGINGTNNPCPSGYRLPTETELDNERSTWTSNNAAGAYGSLIKMPLIGYREKNSGLLLNKGVKSYYWSSTTSGILSRQLHFTSSTAYMDNSYRINGQSVRCIKDFSAPVINCNQTFIYGEVVNTTTGESWLDRNLHASQVAVAYDDHLAYGSLFQWGRRSDGHECISWTPVIGTPVYGETTSLSSTDTPVHSKFITNGSSPHDWRSPKNDNLWQGMGGINNPCPSGFRIPTQVEFDDELATWTSNDATGAFTSALKLSVTGMRAGNGTGMWYQGSFGYYWSSTVSGNRSVALAFFSGDAVTGAQYRANGNSIRCIKD